MENAESKTYHVIGMSPGNSYFNKENITYLLKELLKEDPSVLIMIADIPAISTYIALGYPKNRARTDKAIRNSNNIKNRIRTVLTENQIASDKVRIIDWGEEVEKEAEYKDTYKEVRNLYDTNTGFREACNRTTQSVLEYSGRHIYDMEKSVSIAVHYLLSEIAFLECAPNFLGKKHITYVYHDKWPLYENYISGLYDKKDRREYLGFRKLRNPEELYT